MRIQVNVPIKKNIVSVPRIEGLLNISYLADSTEKLYLKSIPVLWGEYGGEASADDIDKIKKKVRKTDKAEFRTFYLILCKVYYRVQLMKVIQAYYALLRPNGQR